MAIDDDELDKLEDLEDGTNDELSIFPEAMVGPIDAPVYYLQLEYSRDTFFALYSGETLRPGSMVVVVTRYGRDLAKVLALAKNYAGGPEARITRIERVANDEDIEKTKRNKENEESAFSIFREKVTEHGLAMKLISVHYLLEESKILFFFTAENRVDFRELVKDLVAIFKTRIELRQIGVRDESRIKGGMGICGREYCCHAVAEKLNPVFIKMAKDQNLTLNSAKISGSCGRLLCCMSFEYNYYSEQRKFYPPETYKLNFDNTSWRVREINVILGLVTLDSEDGRQLMIPKKRFEKTETGWRIING
jgi:cell fate regulator YaaT (PSP1 superfamily)